MITSKLRFAAYSAGLVLLSAVAAQAADDAPTVSLDTDAAKASYGVGYGFMQSVKAQTEGLGLSKEAIIQGIDDAFAGVDRRVPQEEIQAAIAALQKKNAELATAKAEQATANTRAQGEAFLANNAKQPGVVTTPSGLQYLVLTRGSSSVHPTADSKVKVDYHGTLIDGTVFDSSIDRGTPVEFQLNAVIPGWTEGVQLMSPGDKFRFFIPPQLAYGDRQASAKIPAGSTLIFDVTLLEIL